MGKIFGFLKILLLVNFFGTNVFTDALIIVISIYWFWSNIIVYSLFSVSLIPQLAKTESTSKQLSFALNTLKSVNTLSLFFLFIVLIYPEVILRLFVPFSVDEFYTYGSFLMRVMSPVLILISITEIFTIVNQYRHKMITASLNLTVWNILQALAIYLCFAIFDDPNLLILFFGIATVIGYTITSIMQLKAAEYFTHNSIFKLFYMSWSSTISLIKTNYFYFFSILLTQINIYVDNAFISSLDAGSISKYNIIIKVPELAQSIIISALGVVFFNKIVRDRTTIKPIFMKMISYLFLLFIPALVFSYYLGVDFLKLIYGMNNFETLPELDILLVLMIISVNVFFMVMVALLVKVSIAEKTSKFLFLSSLAAVMINFLGNYHLIEEFQLVGIAISTLCASFTLFILLTINSFYFTKNLKN